AIEAGGEHGMWSFQRYRSWLESRKNWHIPTENAEPAETETPESSLPAGTLAALAAPNSGRPEKPAVVSPPIPAGKTVGRIDIEPTESEFGKILKRPGEQK